MEWNETLAPSMVNTFLLSPTLFTLFVTDPEDGRMVYSVVLEANDVPDTSSAWVPDNREIVKGVVLGGVCCVYGCARKVFPSTGK